MINYEDYEIEVRYRSKKKKPRPKKANHRHEFEPCIIKYFNKNAQYSRERGFVGRVDYAPGARCRICGRLRHGFPTEVVGPEKTWGSLHYLHGPELLEKYPEFEIIEVQDYWTLE